MVKIREKQTEQLEKAASKGLKLGGWKKMTLSSKIAAVVLVLVALTAILAPLLAPYSPVEIFTARQAPGNGFIFGTDDKGRDILSRMLYGGRYSLIIGFGATAMALVCGSIVGALAAVSRKAVSETIMRILDIIMSIPGIALAAVFVSILGNSVPSIIFAIGFMYTPQIARIVRANIVSEYGEDYVRAVIVSGAKAPWILIKHVLRNCIAPIMVFTVTLVADAIIFEASLTFIGAGIQEPTATWGNILADARGGVLAGRWWQALFPGLAIMITCLALNILSEGITDAMAAAPSAALDPTDSSKRREADLLVSDPVRAYKEQAQSLSARLGALRDVELKRDDRHVPDESVEPILSVRDFCIQFEHHGDINVVDHVNFDVRPGQTMGLVGESGCGKYGEDYVRAVIVSGAKAPWILIKHVLRNCIAPIMVFTVTLVADAIIFEASLTFIGAGIQEPTATWGNILADARGGVLAGRWWQALFPGLAIMITCLALNILSEGITDAMAAAPSAALDPTDSSKRREADLLVSDPVRAYKEQAQSLSARLGALRDVELKRDDRHVPDESVEPILSVRDFCIQFEHHGDINVVDHVNFDVRPGQTMGLVGESGCGKSITTLAIMGLTDDDEHLSGEVLWEGRDLLKMSKKEWFGLRGTDIAMVYQDALSSLNPSMLISAQMKQLTKRGGTRSAEELLELVGLDPKRTLESYPHELSGGQRQRVLIAMALTRDPKLVICDEPTTALDVTVQKQVIKLLNDLQAKLGFAMIFVSHDLALVAEVAHNITVMYAGQVIEQAPTKELLTNPIHEYTRGLLGSVLSIESGSGRLHQVPGAVPSPRDFPKGDRFAPRSSHPRIGLDTRPVFKRVPGTEHFYSELPDEVLKANGLTPHAEVM